MGEITFDGQRSGETVQFVFRRHIATMKNGLIWLIVMVVLGIVPLFVWQGQVVMFWIFLGCVGLGLLGLGYTYLLWYFSMYIVTDERIRQINQKGIFTKTMVDLKLDKIQSISYGVTGFFGGMLNYGTILIQTAAGDLTISMVPNPENVYNELQNISKKEENESR